MKKFRIILPLLFFCSLLFSEDNLYTGSAARGSDDSFVIPGGKEGNYGISLIVPAGKSLRVTNLKNNLSVEILVVEGKGKPGIQLLLNSSAADALEIHPGEVPQVTSVELSKKTNPFLSYNEDPEGFKEDMEEEFLEKEKNDPDYGSSVDIDKEMDKLGYEKASDPDSTVQDYPAETPVPEPTEAIVIVETPPIIPAVEDKSKFEDIIIANIKDDIDDTLVIEKSIEDQIPPEETVITPEAVVEPEVIDVPDAAVETLDEVKGTNEMEEPFLSDSILITDPVIDSGEPEKADMIILDEETGEELTEGLPDIENSTETPAEGLTKIENSTEKPVKNPGSVIYFLTQAEPRPPQVNPEVDLESILEEENPAVDEVAELSDPIIENLAEENNLLSLNNLDTNGGLTLFTPQYVKPEEFRDFIDEVENSGSRYIQIFQFNDNNKEALMMNMEKLFESFPYLPITVDNEKNVLLAGPVSRDEVGILLYAVKAHGFKDAMVKRVGK